MTDRLCEAFLRQRGALLGSYGFQGDPTTAERNVAGGVVFYHYTHQDRLDKIQEAGGLYARLPVVAAEHIPELAGRYLVEGLLQPLPAWSANSLYFGDHVLQMLRHYVGDILLRISLPPGFPGIYVVEMAHNLECKDEGPGGQQQGQDQGAVDGVVVVGGDDDGGDGQRQRGQQAGSGAHGHKARQML